MLAVNTSPLMLTDKDDQLLGASSRSDAMGVLAVWSVRGRDLVPHLTEQTTNIRGFQILVEAFRLWELYEPTHSDHAGRLDDFFLLIEQAFARTVGWHDKDWVLPGARRVRARSSEAPHISLQDPDWHLLGGQKANGLWGLYRGAARRAQLLEDDMTRLSSETMTQAALKSRIAGVAQVRLFEAMERAMDGETVPLPTLMTDNLTKALYSTFWDLPMADLLRARLIEGHDLNWQLAKRLHDVPRLDHRTFLTNAAQDLRNYRATIEGAIHCENLLAIVEAIFLWLCASRGRKVENAVADLPVDLVALDAARKSFGRSGIYRRPTAYTRHRRFCEQLDSSSKVTLAHSVLLLHKKVCTERNRAPWVWVNEDQDVLGSDMEVERPSDSELRVGLAWRNDYYLAPLHGIAKQLAEARK